MPFRACRRKSVGNGAHRTCACCSNLGRLNRKVRHDVHIPKYSGSFDEVFASNAITSVKTPGRAPQTNAIAERFVRTVRAECLDWLLFVNRRHLERVLRTFVEHYNTPRPQRSLNLQPPQAAEPPQRAQPPPTPAVDEIRRHDHLGGLIHEYYRDAA
jgi:putative transposase